MFFFIDLFIVILIIILVVLILCGHTTLCERRILAIVQLRIGPALFFFGILTPITDGIKLFLKFTLFVVGFDGIYLIIALLVTTFCMFIGWLFFPIGYIILLDNGFTVFLMLFLHILINVCSVFWVGFFLFSSCFVYMSAMRVLFFSIISESSMLMLFLISFLLDNFSMLSIKDVSIGQLYINNFFLGGILFVGLFWICLLIDGLRIPFDYMECESELVAGLITELSGFFFVIYSILETSHLLLSTILLACFCFGGLFVCFKSLIILIVCFFFPRVIGFRLKITTAQTFIILFLFIMCFLLFNWLAITKLISLCF
uniref:NADH-ubiquinone oxidoreductase chain 1 n=1 Tax=Phytomonas serpens TaxID=5707 RepID=Q9MD53_9TRYP|nr:NADH dehydrogenase subunit 1 [Phytomonas serpens]